MVDSRCAMTLIRDRFLSSLSTVTHGASGMSVCTNISSLAREYSSHLLMDWTSIGESFQRRIGSVSRDLNRFSCSMSETENQYLRSSTPSSTSSRSKMGAWCRNRRYSSLVQKPMTRSTPARLYHERSISTISPAAGRCSMYRWKYHWDRSRSVGAGSATMRAFLGLRYSVIRLIADPLPAASRPSKIATMRVPDSLTHCCMAVSYTHLRAHETD